MHPFIIMRSHNDMPIIRETLNQLQLQTLPFTLLALDNESTDGTLEEIRKVTDRVITIPAGHYIPGKVLNTGMAASTGELVVFLNSDCTPLNPDWLANLLAGFESDRVAAVFGRQVPRPDCHPLMAKDTEDTYGDGSRQQYWRHCFSMASSAIRRSVWDKMPFNEQIRYSEDIEWTWRARRQGCLIRYVPDSIVVHSHNYSLKQFYRRHHGEGRAEASIFEWSRWERSFIRYSLLPFGRQLASDLFYAFRNRSPKAALDSPLFRTAQMLGRWRGFQAGLKEVHS